LERGPADQAKTDEVKIMKILRRLHLHPFLMGIFPVLSLFAKNQSQLEPDAAWRSLMIVLAGTCIVFLLLRWIIGDWTRAGFVTTFASFLFFTYGPFKNIFTSDNILPAGSQVGVGHYLLPLLLVIFIAGTWWLVWKVPRAGNSLLIFNCIALATLILPLVSITSYAITHRKTSTEARMKTSAQPGQTTQPDIYYIIFDMYGRSDAIETAYGYDNSSFLNTLREQGFYVAACSTSNYTVTQLSIASSLNMDYLSAFGDDFTAGKPYSDAAGKLIKGSTVRKYLQQKGYSIVNFWTGYPFLNISDADVFITAPEQKKYIQPFELLLIDQTPGIILYNAINQLAKNYNLFPVHKYEARYNEIKYYLNELTRLPNSVQSPKFVYLHLTIPHPVYVFGPNGEYTGDDERLNGGPNETPMDKAAEALGYINQVQYIDNIFPTIIDKIIARSVTPPVIIIQGDHGFGSWGEVPTRTPILNAYYLPGKDAPSLLYPTITPVNTFRVIFDAYFNAQMELLPDQNYVSMNNQDAYGVTYQENQSIGCQPK
jgi:hypothetical protein